MKDKRIAFFDFCETLVKFQTADKFIDYCRIESNKTSSNLLEFFRLILLRLYFFKFLSLFVDSNNLHKRLKLLQLRGLSKEIIERFAKSYYKTEIKPNLIKQVFEKMIYLRDSGFQIVIVSGGYEEYLKYFCIEYNIKYLISSKISFENKKCAGTILGMDCMNKEKINRIVEIFNLVDYNLDKSYAFSDSDSDIPMLNLVKNKVVVSQGIIPEWALKITDNHIIWK